jgi:hypothetical protein
MLSNSPLLNTVALAVLIALCLTQPRLAVVAFGLWLAWVVVRLLMLVVRRFRVRHWLSHN